MLDPTMLLLGLGAAAAYFFAKKKDVAPPVVAPPGTTPPGTTPPTTPPGDSTIPPDLWGRINRMLQEENDLGKLRELEQTLSNYNPQTDQTRFALTLLRQKIRMIEQGQTPPTTTTPPGTTPPKDLPKKWQDLLSAVLEGLTFHLTSDGLGGITGPVTEKAVQNATSLAGQLERAGYPEYAATLREYIRMAIPFVPKKPDITPKPESVPPDLWAMIQEKMRLEKDPRRLRELLATMQAYRPESPQMTGAIESMKLLIAQIEAAEIVSDTMTKIDDIMPKDEPGGATPPVTPPDIVPKTQAEMLAESVAANLRSKQAQFGMPGAKGKEDQTLVKRFQKELGTTQDGKAGPGTTLKLAENGVSVLPIVMYWPRGATKKTVEDYKAKVRALAQSAREPRSSELLESAAREMGQAGVA